MRSHGYNVTIKLFIPSPRDDFKAQAAAASLMATITSEKTLPAELLEVAKIIDVQGRFGSAELPDEPLPDVEADMLTSDEPTEKPAKKRSAAAATE